MHLHFIDRDEIWIDKMVDLFWDCENVTITEGDVSELERHSATFVCPTNSIGYFDGGVDERVMRTMFPGVEQLIRNRICELDYRTPMGRHYFPVGGAVIAPAQATATAENKWVLAAPAMVVPRDASTTRNAYWSFFAALTLTAQHPHASNTTLVVPPPCAGYMHPYTIAEQLHEAYTDFIAKKNEGKKLLEMQDVVVFKRS